MEIWQNPALPSLAPWSQSFRWHCELETSFFRIAVENRAYHYLSQLEIRGAKRISRHLCGPDRFGCSL